MRKSFPCEITLFTTVGDSAGCYGLGTHSVAEEDDHVLRGVSVPFLIE